MKGAVSFFKNFGRRQIHKCCRSKMEDPSLLLSTDKVYELEDNDIGFELEDNDKGFELEDDSKTEQFDVDSKYVDCSKLRDSIDKIGEMEDNSRNKARDIDASLMLSPSSPKACEIDGNELPPRKRRGSLVREAHQSDHISLPGRPDREVVLELSAPGRALENHKLPSFRTSEAGSNLSISNVDKTTNTSAVKHASIFEPIIATLPSSQDVEPDELKHTMADLEFYPIHTGYGFNSVGQAWTLRTPEALVKDTQEQARSLNNAWAKKLTSMPQFRHLKSRLYRTSVFESGLHSLGMCLEGRIPSSFEGVFSMMHVVLSFAYILYSHESMTFPWDALFEDIFRWRYAITNEADSILYSEVAHAIWPSVTSMKTMALYKSLDIIESSSPDSNIQENKKRRAVYFHEPPFCACQTQPLSSLEHQKSHLKDLLSKGNVIKLCTRYLDGNS